MRACTVAIVVAATGCQQLLGLHDLPPGPPIDAPANDARDGAGSDGIAATWTIDPLSHIATPASTMEWSSFLAAKQLAIAPPDGLWLLQEPSGTARDSVGAADLSPLGSVLYQQSVAGWARRAVAMPDGSGDALANTTDAALPDLSQTSMTVLALFALTQPSTPGNTRTVLAAGHSGAAEVDVTTTTLSLDLTGTTFSGAHAYGATVFPIVLVLDHTHQLEVVHTPFESIAASPYISLAASSGAIFLGHANHSAPGGEWLYAAAWYGAHGELSDSDATKLITALGF